jgi:hypothetical protein
VPNLVILLAALVVVSCRTEQIGVREPIVVPSGLTENEIQIAILTALTDLSHPPAYDPNVIVAGSVGDAIAWSLFKEAERSSSGWYPESHEPGVIFAGLDVRSHYMRIAIHYDTKSVRTQIVESRNLKQSGGRIHRKANAWLAKLEAKIRVALGQVSFSAAHRS